MRINHIICFMASAIFAMVCLSSCESSYPEEVLSPTKDNSPSFLTRSEAKGDGDKYEITAEMAQEYVRIIKGKSEIVSTEAYTYKGVTCFYIINFEKGWMAVSADSRAKSILGDSEVDNLDPETLENEGLKAWLETTANFIYHVKTFGRPEGEINPKTVAFWNGIKKGLSSSSSKSLEPGGDPTWVKIITVSTSNVVDSVPHLIETKWGQSYPWNMNLPLDPVILELGFESHFLTGCAPTAVSQVLYYFHSLTGYPSDLWHQITPTISQSLNGGKYKLSLSKSDYYQYSPHWESMLKTQNGTGNASYVSDLIMDVGVRMNATYASAATSAPLYSYSNLSPCGFTSANSSSYSYSTVKSNILDAKPVLVVAYNNQNSGHAWIIDGLVDRTFSTDSTIIYYAYQTGVLYPTGAIYLTDAEAHLECPNIYDGWSRHTHYSDSTKYLLMNYGWDGQNDNGCYSIDTSNSNWIYSVSPLILYNLETGNLL